MLQLRTVIECAYIEQDKDISSTFMGIAIEYAFNTDRS